MSDHTPSECRRCGGTIFWHKSKAGKSYPTNSQDRKDFHNCDAAPGRTAPISRPAAPLDATPLERLAALEDTVTKLVRTVKELQAARPISDEDIAF
jgi:hypothetical protein